MSNIDTTAAIPVTRKQWFALLACLVFPPLGLFLLWRGPTYRRNKGVWEPVPRRDKLIITVLGLIVIGFQLSRIGGGKIDSLPLCDASATLRSLKGAVENSPAGRTQGLRLIEVENPHETAWSSTEQVRLCAGDAVTNGATLPIQYRLRWLDQGKGRWLVEFQIN